MMGDDAMIGVQSDVQSSVNWPLSYGILLSGYTVL